MQHLHARNVVLGAGAMGSATAYHLAKRGEPVLLLEQFTLGHDRGSSHGAGRITRHSYADPRYARLMPDAFRAWRELEADACQNLYLRTGGVSFCPPAVDYVARVTEGLATIGIPHRRLSGGELNRAFPAFQVPDDTDAVFEPDAGMLAAARCVAMQVSLARHFGGERTQVWENSPVRRIDLEADQPTLMTDQHVVVADHLVVTAGAWARRILPAFPAPLRPTLQQVLYFRPTDPGPFSPGRFPVFIYKGEEEWNDFYGMPEFLGLGVKVARHGGPEVDPDKVDRTVAAEYHELVRRFLRECLPALADAPTDLAEVCLYTVAPDDRFYLGAYPGRSDVVVASPCSGHGFKFSCLIGRILADLATRGETDLAIDLWQL